MQTCTRCQSQNIDTDRFCKTCGADLSEYSNYAIALKNFHANPDVIKVKVSVDEDACPVCQAARGSYTLDCVPRLPIRRCSNPNGCRCSYEPWLKEIHP